MSHIQETPAKRVSVPVGYIAFALVTLALLSQAFVEDDGVQYQISKTTQTSQTDAKVASCFQP